VNRDWRSRWYALPQEFPAFLHSDLKIRNYVKKKLQFAAVSKIVIERAWNSNSGDHSHRASRHRNRTKRCRDRKDDGRNFQDGEGKQVKIDIQEIKTPELDAQLVAEKRSVTDRAADCLSSCYEKKPCRPRWTLARKEFGCGVPAGLMARRFRARNGIEREKFRCTTLRTPIDYGFAKQTTVYGKIGVKCWMCKKEELALNRSHHHRHRTRAG